LMCPARRQRRPGPRIPRSPLIASCVVSGCVCWWPGEACVTDAVWVSPFAPLMRARAHPRVVLLSGGHRVGDAVARNWRVAV